MGRSKPPLREGSEKISKARGIVDAAIQTIAIVKGFVPFPPAQAALESLGVFLGVAQVRSFSHLCINILSDQTLGLHEERR